MSDSFQLEIILIQPLVSANEFKYNIAIDIKFFKKNNVSSGRLTKCCCAYKGPVRKVIAALQFAQYVAGMDALIYKNK